VRCNGYSELSSAEISRCGSADGEICIVAYGLELGSITAFAV
jgi:hypothetical protein